MDRSKIQYDGFGKPFRTFKVCGMCGSPAIDFSRYSACRNFYKCHHCGVTLIWADEQCIRCQKRIDCLAYPSLKLVSEVEYFYPVGGAHVR